ncbi:MAG TPA: hypothetical protein VLC28_06595 [Flavitalea sp.]|nr:hypothetical protein [Flavitalea sp.]
MDTYSTPFTKAVLTGLFVGMAATLLCFGYDIAFRETVTFNPSSIINVSSMIFAINLLFLVIGIIYHGFRQLKQGEIIYIVLSLGLTALFAFMAMSAHRSDNSLVNTRFHQLLVPIVIIIGLCASIGIPVLWHSRKFEEHVI